MEQPKRIQRKRVKGWKMPENTVYVGRPTKWGNPFIVVQEGLYWWVKDNANNYWDARHIYKESAVRRCIEIYRAWAEGKIGIGVLKIEDLRGKNLACFCPLDSPCHADVLLELANL